ncbi:helix-turn-helix domain-containing protein [Bradyrhizobium neotropicale]|uniref:helix-turn-helix domain-containing protein n=1 Tax=Bradyrhizobium neotropicale TaxID=1497615 RepID=UPI001AD66756|nr:helix-turn-helix domain-containing protein [Bradyrhizobium neotropicale]MBO4227506.1 helix-turn-helix domain-containing protein [Bradyrhizobium neotropicale]
MKISELGEEAHCRSCHECTVRSFAICGALDTTELRELAQLTRHVCLESDATVFAQANIATSFFNVHEGTLRLHKLLPDSRRQILGFALPGDFLGLSSVPQHEFSADAIGRVALCQFSKESFATFAENRPRLLCRIIEMAGRELARAQEHMVSLGRRSAEEKVASFLIGWRDRLSAIGRGGEILPLPMRRLDIADHLGLTVETVSRTFSKFERNGVIQIFAGSVVLLDVPRAETLSGIVS